LLALLLLVTCAGCHPATEVREEFGCDDYAINMNTNFAVQDTLPAEHICRPFCAQNHPFTLFSPLIQRFSPL